MHVYTHMFGRICFLFSSFCYYSQGELPSSGNTSQNLNPSCLVGFLRNTHLCSDAFPFSICIRSTWFLAAISTCVFSSNHFCSLKNIDFYHYSSTELNKWNASERPCLSISSIFPEEGKESLNFTHKVYAQFFGFFQFVSLRFLARKNHLQFRAQFEHLRKTKRKHWWHYWSI